MTAESIFSCDSEIVLERPFNGEERVWSLWADQNCKEFDLMLTVVFNPDAFNSLLGYTGASLSGKGCVELSSFEGVLACEYEIKANNDAKFGLLFNGEFAPVYYTTEWVLSSSFVPAFNWW